MENRVMERMKTAVFLVAAAFIIRVIALMM
jgi:hypothetical protein